MHPSDDGTINVSRRMTWRRPLASDRMKRGTFQQTKPKKNLDQPRGGKTHGFWNLLGCPAPDEDVDCDHIRAPPMLQSFREGRAT